MVWSCNSCGKLGEREGVAEAGWCHRAGLATMKGIMQCCNCMLNCGWDGYDEHGCRACMRSAKRRLPIGSARRQQTDAVVEKAFSTLPQQPKLNGPVFQNSLPFLEGVKRIAVFEFDGVLFRTPKRPNWWPYNSYHGMIESLLPPTVPTTPSDSWWNSDVVAQAKAAFEDPDTWSVLITYRGDAFKSRVHNLLRSQGICFNETRFRALTPFLSQLGATNTGSAGYGGLVPNLESQPQTLEDKHSLVVLGEILSRCTRSAALLELWACSNLNNNRAANLSQIIRATRARDVKIHGVDSPQHESGMPTAAELAAMVQARTLEKRLSRKGHIIPVGLIHGSSRTSARQHRRALPSVSENAQEVAAARMRKVVPQVTVRTANWPAEVYAGRRRGGGRWLFDVPPDTVRRNDVNVKLAAGWEEGEEVEESDEEGEEGAWEEEDGEEEEEESTTMAEEESTGWGWGGGIEFEWVDEADEVLSMTNSSAWSAACDEVRSMCSASVVGASDVMSVDCDQMSVDSSWTEVDDWRGAAFEDVGDDEGAEERAARHEEGGGEEGEGSFPSVAVAAPYLEAVLRAGDGGQRKAATGRGCEGGRRRPVRSAGTEEAEAGEEVVGGELTFPCGGGWKKARNRKEGRRRLRRMVSKLEGDQGFLDHIAPTKTMDCMWKVGWWGGTKPESGWDMEHYVHNASWDWIDASLKRHKRTPVHLAPDMARVLNVA